MAGPSPAEGLEGYLLGCIAAWANLNIRATATCITEISQFASILRFTAGILKLKSYLTFQSIFLNPRVLDKRKKANFVLHLFL